MINKQIAKYDLVSVPLIVDTPEFQAVKARLEAIYAFVHVLQCQNAESHAVSEQRFSGACGLANHDSTGPWRQEWRL